MSSLPLARNCSIVNRRSIAARCCHPRRTTILWWSARGRRGWPIRDLGPLTDDYSLTSDWNNQWLTGGLEADVLTEAHLDPASIFDGIRRFADERSDRLARQAGLLDESRRG